MNETRLTATAHGGYERGREQGRRRCDGSRPGRCRSRTQAAGNSRRAAAVADRGDRRASGWVLGTPSAVHRRGRPADADRRGLSDRDRCAEVQFLGKLHRANRPRSKARTRSQPSRSRAADTIGKRRDLCGQRLPDLARRRRSARQEQRAARNSHSSGGRLPVPLPDVLVAGRQRVPLPTLPVDGERLRRSRHQHQHDRGQCVRPGRRADADPRDDRLRRGAGESDERARLSGLARHGQLLCG